ncbi:prephenate dehydrogenase [Allisonella histaminiformans]|uniref:prephenate dehydrogenase n=1 Tax=Allisonella histaminiformans TaxID=209880 RepID=UPI002E7950FA|nr:prephenate dehydrogenase [Allisonella histaminiformans]
MNSDFKNRPVAVIGLGLMGGSFAERLTELGCFVIGFNRTVETAERALTMGIVKSVDPEELKKAEIVIFCTPVKGTLAFLREHADWLKAGAILTDIAGVKDHTWPLIRELLPPGMDFVQAHPMCGREGAGLSQADGTIFRDCNYVLIPEKENKPENLALIAALARALGAWHVPQVTSEAHDRFIAYTSGLPHAVAASLMNSESYEKDTGMFIGGSFTDATRVADINSRLWTSLFLSNRDKILAEMESFQESLCKLRKALETEDAEALCEFFTEAKRRRREMIHHGSR